MKRFLFLLSFIVVCSIVVISQDKKDRKDEFVLKLVDDVMSVCEEGKDTTLKSDGVVTSDSVLSYIVRLKSDSVIVDSLSADDKKVIADLVKVVASKADGDEEKTIVTTVKKSKKTLTFDLDFDALDSLVFEIDLDSLDGVKK